MKFYQLTASLSVVLSQINLTILKLEYLKFVFKRKKEHKNTEEYFCITRVRLFFEFNSSLLLEYGRIYFHYEDYTRHR